MPTLDELRAVLVDRERFAPDADDMLQRIAVSRRRRMTPILAAASVAALAAAAVALTSTHHTETGQPAGHGRASDASGASAGPTPLTGPPATTAPPGPRDTSLKWSFTVYNLPDYTVTPDAYTPDEETAHIVGKGGSGTITLFHPGIVAHPPSGGTQLSLFGRPATYLTTASTAALWWEYPGGGWARVEGTFGQSDIVSIAQALDFGQFDDVRSPLQPAVGAGYLVEAVRSRPYPCIGYGRGEAYQPDGDLGTVLTVCLTPTSESNTVAQPGDRVVRRMWSDIAIVVVLNRDHLDALDTDALNVIAQHTLIGDLNDRSTWSPVTS